MMGLLGDNKKKVAAILGDYKPVVKEKEIGPVEGDFSLAKESLAGEIISALDEKDPKKLMKSLSQFMQMCDKEEDYSEVE